MASYSSLGGGLVMVINAGAPSDGSSGTGAGVAGPGSLLIDSTNKNLYQNTNTKASPTWTQFSDLSGVLAFTDLDAGASGTAGSIDVFPTTATSGKIHIVAADNAANHTVTLTNASHGQATSHTIPDPGVAAASVVVSNSANTVIFNANAGDRTVSLAGNVTFAGAVSLGGALTTAAAVTFSGANTCTIVVPAGGSSWTLPTGGGTLAVATGAETGTTNASFTVDSDSAAAKIALSSNAATGNFTATLVPANLTANRTISFADAAGTVMLLGANQTVSGNLVLTGTADFQGNITASSGNPSIDLSGSSAAFSTSHGTNTLHGNVTSHGNITFSMSGSSGTFDTSTGTNTLNGDVVIAGTKALTTGTGAVTVKGATTFDAGLDIAFSGAGDGTFDMNNQTGIFRTSTGAVTLGGDTTISGSKTFSTGTGTVTVNGTVSVAANINAACVAGTSSFDWHLGTGTFLTSTGQNTLSGDVSVAAGKDIVFAAGAGYLELNGVTSGGIKVKPIDIGTGTTTVQNSATAAATITLPAATCTLPGVGLANTFTATQTVSIDDASNNAVTDLLTLTHTTSGASTAGIGAGLAFQIEDLGGTEEQASIDAVLATVTDGAEDCDLIVKTQLNGTVCQVLKVDSVNQTLVVGQNASDADGLASVTIYPVTASRGSLVLSAVAHASADRSTTIQTATDAAGAVTLTLPNITGTIASTAQALTWTATQTLDGGDLILGDSDGIKFGDGSGGDVAVEWNATYLQATSLAKPMWTAAPSVVDPAYHAIAHDFFDDFVALSTNWTVSETAGGCTQAAEGVAGGAVILTNETTTDNSGCQIQWANESFKLAAGKTLWFEARVRAAARKAGADSEIDLAIGLWKTEDLKAVDDNMPGDGVVFRVTEGTKVWVISSSKDGTDTGAVTTAVDLAATWVTLGLLIDGVTSITPYIDGVAQTALTATICDDEELAPGFLVRNGDGTITQTLEIDYVKIVQLR